MFATRMAMANGEVANLKLTLGQTISVIVLIVSAVLTGAGAWYGVYFRVGGLESKFSETIPPLQADAKATHDAVIGLQGSERDHKDQLNRIEWAINRRPAMPASNEPPAPPR
jgi:hypothetical protein